MGLYYCNGAATTGANKAMVMLGGSASIRPKLHEMLIGFTGTPDDRLIDLVLKRVTTAGSGGTAVAAADIPKCDPDTPNATCTFTVGQLSSEPTKAAQGLAIPIYNRQTYRWIADVSRPILGVKSANNGLILDCISIGPSGTPTVETTLFWEE